MTVLACTVDETCGMAEELDCVPEHGPVERIETVLCPSCHKVCGLPHQLIEKIALSTWARWRDFSELDDVRQEVWVAYLSRRQTHDAMLAEGNEFLLWKILQRAAGAFCRKSKAWYCGYMPADEYMYSKGTLRALLPRVFAGVHPSTEGGGFTGGDLDTMHLDIKAALLKLDQADRQTLFEVYYTHEDHPTASPNYDKAQRLLKKLQEQLGGPPG